MLPYNCIITGSERVYLKCDFKLLNNYSVFVGPANSKMEHPLYEGVKFSKQGPKARIGIHWGGWTIDRRSLVDKNVSPEL